MIEFIPLILFIVMCASLLLGFPVAFTLGGVSLIFAGLGSIFGIFDLYLLETIPNRLFGIMTNSTLVAVPLFVFMGVILEKSKIAEKLLESMSEIFGNLKSGLGISVIIVGTLLAASTGIVGATVIAMGLISLPAMLKKGYSEEVSTGLIAATGTLGQIIPPSIALVILGDVLATAYQQAQLSMGNFSAKSFSVGDLFVAAIIPGLLLVTAYSFYFIFSISKKNLNYEESKEKSVSLFDILKILIPPFLLIFSVLGSIILGVASPTEAAGIGAMGSILIALLNRKLSFSVLADAVKQTAFISSMVFMILIGASIFSLVFRGFGGEELITNLFNAIPGGLFGSMLIVMILVFLLGFILDFIEISFVVVPIVGPILIAMGADPLWLGIMLAINLQTSFLTPPFGFALFYLRGVTPEKIKTETIYKGVIPFIFIQILILCLVAYFPFLATYLPSAIY
ncbi:TRAP transporter large permease subunit [SAR86 cluster bacterium]|jgi:tripartite ATP-independent transporter DctM subunit|nr:TRAP transporter large permease subunit [SAR86 cluster bacterium]